MAEEKLILALDVSSAETALAWADRASPWVRTFKVGLELFASCGPSIVRQIRANGSEVFLDLKLMDIPRTVERTVAAACGLGVRMITLHTMGGRRMLEAAAWRAREEAGSSGTRPLLLGVTLLTSLDKSDLGDLGIPCEIQEQVDRLARLARETGLDGVVAAPAEARRIKQLTQGRLKVVTPAIRPSGSGTDDQRRIATPRGAVEAGADFLVVGRPVLESSSPDAVLRAICDEIGSPTG